MIVSSYNNSLSIYRSISLNGM